MTIPKGCKRLAEVDFPIAEVSKHAAREKSIRHGHPSTLHLWWARRPLASSRAVLLALLLPDPLDPLCPAEFKTQARELLSQVQKLGKSDADLRAALLKFIGDFANWDLASKQQYLNVSRGLVKAAHPDETPLVVDPFAGGGSIPLEALRLGCDAFASDLNPVAGLIQKVMLEDIPRYGRQKIKVQTAQGEVEADGLAEALRLAGAEIKKAAEKELVQFYPPDPDGARPIAYLWARTVRCESPNCGAEIPLVRSFWLSKKSNRRRALRPKIIREDGKTPRIEFEIYIPKNESDIGQGTVQRAKATCLCCQTILPAERVRAQLVLQNGGANVIFDENGKRIGGALLLSVVTKKTEESSRNFRLSSLSDYEVSRFAKILRQEVQTSQIQDAFPVLPNEPTPSGGGSGAGRAFSIQKYGMMTYSDMFTDRQMVTLSVLSKIVRTWPDRDRNQFALKLLLALSVSRFIDDYSALTRWMDRETPAATFSRPALPILWDFCETWPLDTTSWSLSGSLEWVAMATDRIQATQPGQAQLANATKSPLPDHSSTIWFTDPPYYDAIPYSDLSDYFFVWLKRMSVLDKLFGEAFISSNYLVPKLDEIVQDDARKVDGKPKDRKFFENSMTLAFSEGFRVLQDEGIGCVVFAHKTTEGWEALLSGMIRGGWTITGSWPIVTERANRPRSQDSAALATSVHLICRPRSESAEIGDWMQVSRELPRKVGDWMQRLQNEGVRGADLVFACIGPALEIYSRYSMVVDAEDREIPLGGDPEAREPHLRGYLAYVWEVVGRLALEQVLGSDETSPKKDTVSALEEDARLTALFLWTKQSASHSAEKPSAKAPKLDDEDEAETEDDEDETPKTKGKSGGHSLPFDVVRRFAQPLGIHLPEWENRIISTDKGVVTLISVKDRARQLFGEKGASAFASEIEDDPSRPMQMSLFPEAESAPKVRGRRKSKKEAEVSFEQRREATTLDRLHAAMLLQKNGQTNALRTLLQAESDRGPDFMRLANALSALYPRESEEKRLLDALLVNIRRK